MIPKRITYAFLNAGAVLLLAAGLMVQRPAAQDEEASRFRMNVVLVELEGAVTDNKGNYITGLRPEDFAITEDNIQEKLANFEEGDESIRKSNVPDPLATPVDRGPPGQQFEAKAMGTEPPGAHAYTRRPNRAGIRRCQCLCAL